MLPFPAIYEGQRVPWFNNKRLIDPVIGGNLLLVFLTVLLWPVAVLIRRKYQRPLFAAKRRSRSVFLSRIVCVGELIFILGAGRLRFSQGLELIVILGDRDQPMAASVSHFRLGLRWQESFS